MRSLSLVSVALGLRSGDLWGWRYQVWRLLFLGQAAGRVVLKRILWQLNKHAHIWDRSGCSGVLVQGGEVLGCRALCSSSWARCSRNDQPLGYTRCTSSHTDAQALIHPSTQAALQTRATVDCQNLSSICCDCIANPQLTCCNEVVLLGGVIIGCSLHACCSDTTA